MIKQGVCKYCSESLRANGDYKFKNLVDNHFRIKHPKEHQHLHLLIDNANQKFKELRDKYPELFYSYFFQIDWDKLLSKPQTIG